MVIAISVGSCYDLKLERNDTIRFIQKYSDKINGIELLFATPKELLAFEFDKDTLNFVRSLDFVSIHMPVIDAEYKNDSETKKVIAKATAIYKSVKAEYLVFHPNTIKDYSILNWNLTNCVENLNSKEYNQGFQTVTEMRTLLEQNTGLKLVLDTCHMLEAKINPAEFLELKDYVKGIHLAVQWKQGERIRTHGFLQENPEQLEQIKPLLKLDVPKIIESDFYPEKVSLIEKELDLIKKLSK
jgi:endonuclease IV